mgnify:CR=1 FL=1
MIMFYVMLAVLALFAGLNWKKDRTSSLLFLILIGLWLLMYAIFGVAPDGVID